MQNVDEARIGRDGCRFVQCLHSEFCILNYDRQRMRRALLLLALFIAAFVQPHAQTPPKLIVVLVVDQMRADYLQRFDRHWRGGFRTLLDKGMVFENARYPYLGTVTCAGHSTIGTGALPHTHGMISNGWWARDEHRLVGCTADPASPDISYGRPGRLGNSAVNLLVPTLADELRGQKPGARVVAVSLKARSAIGLAGHGGDAVVWFDDASGSWATSRAFAPAPVPAVKEFIDKNPFEQDLNRDWVLTGPPAGYLSRDAGVGERPPAGWNGLFPHPIKGRGGVDAQFFALWQATPLADAYLMRMAASLVDSLSLGQGSTTDFLGISFSTLDEVGHSFGPDSREIEDVLRQLDATIGSLIERLDARVGRANYLLALSADHGVAPNAVAPRGGRIAPEDVRERIEETLAVELGPLAKGTYVDAVNFTDVYFMPGVYERLRSHGKAMTAVEHAIKEIPGVAAVLRADQLSPTSSDSIVRSAALSYLNGRSGDLIVVPQEYWYLSGRNATFATTHGTHHEYDIHVPLILFGGGLNAAHVATRVTPADIAPTLARLAGVKLSKAEGRAVSEAAR
jgi:predicted AlkP superfamily pyrophosphatase or phosphodiesterase